MKRKNSIRESRGERILEAVIKTILILLVIIICYPCVYVLSSSFSSGQAVSTGKVLLWPVDFSTLGYEIVFNYKMVWTGYKNTLIYTFVGTCLNLVLTILAAYPLSRKNFQGRNFYMFIFMFTMFFSGGIIPSYILMANLGLTDTRWAVILTGSISVYNMIIMRTFFQNSIPNDLFEAAKIDGISDIGYLFKIVLPLSKAIIAVIVLYYAVAHWNAYFNAMLYTRSRELYPLQLVIQGILGASNIDITQVSDASLLAQMQYASDLIKYSLIVIAAAPVMIAYPFFARFFEKGVMIGSVKG